jgi:hypothetical protein
MLCCSPDSQSLPSILEAASSTVTKSSESSEREAPPLKKSRLADLMSWALDPPHPPWVTHPVHRTRPFYRALSVANDRKFSDIVDVADARTGARIWGAIVTMIPVREHGYVDFTTSSPRHSVRVHTSSKNVDTLVSQVGLALRNSKRVTVQMVDAWTTATHDSVIVHIACPGNAARTYTMSLAVFADVDGQGTLVPLLRLRAWCPDSVSCACSDGSLDYP